LLEVATSFSAFCAEAQPQLRHAFAARYGYSDGADATAEALAYAWEHWDRIRVMANPVGYLYRVGQSRTRRIRRPARVLVELPDSGLPMVEPALPSALASLSEKQRVSVILVHCFGWAIAEVAELLEVEATTVRTHVERGLENLRRSLTEAT
jgi:DNA-directed RNA polymerase specialized sigma24 family protein